LASTRTGRTPPGSTTTCSAARTTSPPTGLPISPNTHEITRDGHPEARVVYVDNDPVVFMRAESLMAGDPAGVVARYLAALAPGSYLVISHVTGDFAPEQMHAVTEQYAERGTVFVGRSRGAITGLFNGREPLDPGVVRISYWRPRDGRLEENADRVWGYAGVARV
jgi:hypothetical protein